MSHTEENKTFVEEMISSKRLLGEYPDRYDPQLTVFEPAHLPFGGVYRGFEEFQTFYPKVRDFYDFETFQLVSVHGDGDTVYATVSAQVKDTRETLHLVERFVFSGRQIVEVRVFVCGDGEAGG